MNNAYICREVRGTGRTIGVEEKQGMVHALQPTSGYGPVHDFIVDISGSHVVDVLGIVFAADCFSHADELAWLRDDLSDVTALADPGKFTIVNGGPIHDD